MLRAWTLHEALIYGQGVERPFLCPVHGDSRPSASVNTIKNVWYCYSCGASGGLTGEDALMDPDYDVMSVWFTDMMEAEHVYPEAWLDRWDAGDPHPYWVGRVGAAATRHFRLGWDHERESATYPFRSWTGQPLGVVRRGFREDGPKYLYPKGLDVGQHLFNYSDTHRRLVVLVEGAVDAIALWNVGIHAFAIYGSQLSDTQIQLIDRVDPEFVVTAFDADEAGRSASWDVERAFKHRLTDQLRWPRGWGKDVAELGSERLGNIGQHLVCDDVTCLESEVCRSRSSAKTKPSQSTQSSRTTSRPSRLRIVPSRTSESLRSAS